MNDEYIIKNNLILIHFLEDASRFIGSDSNNDSFGVIPSAIHGLFSALNGQRSTHFYLTVSAVEIPNYTDQRSTDLFSELNNGTLINIFREKFYPSY